MPEYRLILRTSTEESSEILDVKAEDVEMVLRFLRRQSAFIKLPVELWSDGKLMVSVAHF